MKIRLVSVLIILVMFLQTDGFSQDTEAASFSKGFLLGSATTLGIGAITYFGIRYFQNKNNRGDSLATYVENARDSALIFCTKDDYSSAIEQTENARAHIFEYRKYCRKKQRPELVNGDTLKDDLKKYKLLQTLLPIIISTKSISDSIPDNEQGLTEIDRRPVQALKLRCTAIIDSVSLVYPRYTSVIRYGFRNTITKMENYDRLLSGSYEDEKANFELKCKFFYNRAIETGDTNKIRRFVEDCDYYKSNKEWCTRGQMLLETKPDKPENMITYENFQPVVLNKTDSMKIEYQQVINSLEIDQLDAYVRKYSSKKFKKVDSNVEIVQKLADSLKNVRQTELTYESSHPLFLYADLNDMQLTVSGVSSVASNKFTRVVESMKKEFNSIQGARFPALLKIDYTASQPVLYLNASINCEKDIFIKQNEKSITCDVLGASSIMKFLHDVKNNVVNDVEILSKEENDKIRSAVYVVRLWKNTYDYITFYGSENYQSKNGIAPFQFYNILDISVGDKKDIRLQNNTAQIIEIPQAQSDSFGDVLKRAFFTGK